MIRTVMESAGLVFWPILSLILFILFILGLSLWLYRRGSKPFYDKMAGLAVNESDEPGKAESLEGRR